MQYKQQLQKGRLQSAKDKSPLQKSFKMKEIENIYQIDEPVSLKNNGNILGRPPLGGRKIKKPSRLNEDSRFATQSGWSVSS